MMPTNNTLLHFLNMDMIMPAMTTPYHLKTTTMRTIINPMSPIHRGIMRLTNIHPTNNHIKTKMITFRSFSPTTRTDQTQRHNQDTRMTPESSTTHRVPYRSGDGKQ